MLTARREQLQATLSLIQQELRATTTTHADAADQAVASYDKNALHQQAEQASLQRLSSDSASVYRNLPATSVAPTIGATLRFNSSKSILLSE